MTTVLDSSFLKFWIWTNHNSLLGIATNQFASFCRDIRSGQCYFHVCQSGEIWNKKTFFPYILIFLLHIKLIDSIWPCICSVIDHRGHQNVVSTSVAHLAAPRMPLFCSYHILTSSVIYYWTDARQHGIYLLISKRQTSEQTSWACTRLTGQYYLLCEGIMSSPSAPSIFHALSHFSPKLDFTHSHVRTPSYI